MAQSGALRVGDDSNPGKTACLRCMHHSSPPAEQSPVLGATPGVVASIQVTEVIKYFTGMGELLTNRLLIYDGISMTFREFQLKRNPECDHCGVNVDEMVYF